MLSVRTLSCIILVCSIASTMGYAHMKSNAADPYSGPTWEQQSADSKMSTLWKDLTADTTPLPWFSTVLMAELFIESMNVTFDTVAEDLPKQGLLHTDRHKLIHTVGGISQCVWEPVGSHNYTGIFQSGADNVLCRLSTAAKPVPGNYPPGLSVKILIDGKPSVNVMAMYSLTGQDSYNFFKHDLTNHVPTLGTAATLAEKALLQKFETASAWPNMLGVSTWSQHDQKGNAVAKPNFPYRLIFHPALGVHNKYPDSDPGIDLPTQLETLQKGKIYDVYAQGAPFATPEMIATLSVTSEMTGSNFGDKKLFYQHVRMENDFVFHPEWIGSAFQITRSQQSVPKYVYPDLPW